MIQFLATPAILHQDDLKKKVNSSYASNCPGVIRPVLPIVLVQNSSRGKELNQFCPLNNIDDFSLLFCLYPSSMGPCLVLIENKQREEKVKDVAAV